MIIADHVFPNFGCIVGKYITRFSYSTAEFYKLIYGDINLEWDNILVLKLIQKRSWYSMRLN